MFHPFYKSKVRSTEVGLVFKVSYKAGSGSRVSGESLGPQPGCNPSPALVLGPAWEDSWPSTRFRHPKHQLNDLHTISQSASNRKGI